MTSIPPARSMATAFASTPSLSGATIKAASQLFAAETHWPQNGFPPSTVTVSDTSASNGENRGSSGTTVSATSARSLTMARSIAAPSCRKLSGMSWTSW